MIHIGLSLLTVALESGATHIGAFPSLMNLISDELCKNLFMVSVCGLIGGAVIIATAFHHTGIKCSNLILYTGVGY